MGNVIELTDKQMEALNNGESVTISPPEKVVKPWEPRGGRWYVEDGGSVYNAASAYSTRKFGVERDTEEAAQKAADAMRVHNRLLAYVAEFDPDYNPDWSDNSESKWTVVFNGSNLKFDSACTYIYETIGAVHMPKECAEKLIEKLNSGEVVL